MNKNLLYVEDNASVRELYSEMLSQQGFCVRAYSDCSSALAGAIETLPDIALLDISLHDERDAGFQLCAELRRLSKKLPILFLTSHEQESEKISGIRLGADDYITKDASLDYLVIRIEALLRRCAELSNQELAPGGSNEAIRTVGPLTIDMEKLRVTWQQQPVQVSLGQVRMIYALVEHPGQVTSFSKLMHNAGIVVEPNTITAHIRAIRNAFKTIDPDFANIVNERGQGYRWSD